MDVMRAVGSGVLTGVPYAGVRLLNLPVNSAVTRRPNQVRSYVSQGRVRT